MEDGFVVQKRAQLAQAIKGNNEITARATAKLDELRAVLAGLKAKEQSLKLVATKATNQETTLRSELDGLEREGAALRHAASDSLSGAQTALKNEAEEDSSFYTREGWSDLEAEFRRLWDPQLPREESRCPIAGASLHAMRPLKIEALLGAVDAVPPGPALLSEQPLVAFVPNFLTAKECTSLIDLGFRTCQLHRDWTLEMQRPGNRADAPVRRVATANLGPDQPYDPGDEELVQRLRDRVGRLTGIEPHTHEMHPFLKYDHPGEVTRASDDAAAGGDELTVGLHVDTNSGFPHCVCSVIMYLNAVDAGRTLFPCVGDEECQGFGAELAAAGVTHTSSEQVKSAGLDSCASELLDRARSSPGALRVTPRRGDAVLFFSLLGEMDGDPDSAPKVDPWAWHGGAAVEGNLAKWTLQIFKEVPLHLRAGSGGTPESETAYIASLRARLLASATDVCTLDLNEMD